MTRRSIEAVCPLFHHAVELIGRRWTGVILQAMFAGRIRYGQIRDAVPGLSDTMLRARLRELESEGIVTREVVPGPPIRVHYRLTPKGRALKEVVETIEAWADEWIEGPTEDAASLGRQPQPAAAG